MSESRLRIVAVHQELLGTYGDIGNAKVLSHRAMARGIQVEVILARSDAPLPASGDIYLFGGGEDSAQIASVNSLRTHGGATALANALDNGAALLAICAGLQILGEYFPGSEREQVSGIGLLPLHSVPGDKRLVGELALNSTEFSKPLTGFENHRGRTVLADGVKPLGDVFLGTGNGGGDSKVDGILFGKVVGSYMHGPALARNPELADHLLSLILGGLAPYEDQSAAALAAERRTAAKLLASR